MPRPRREQAQARSHDEMAAQIKAAARRQMAEHGTAGISLRAIARQLGITAPAIYNYYGRLDDLITALIVDAFTAQAEAMEAAQAGITSERCWPRIRAAAEAFRTWAIEHPVDFQLIYGNPIPGYHAPGEITVPLAQRPFLGIFRAYLEAYQTGELVIPPEYEDVPPETRAAIAEWRRASGIDMPDALVGLLISSWARIHGAVMLELFNHIQPLVGDGGEFYGYQLDALARRLGMLS
jgi:AcrR family transcriptional regulator